MHSTSCFPDSGQQARRLRPPEVTALSCCWSALAPDQSPVPKRSQTESGTAVTRRCISAAARYNTLLTYHVQESPLLQRIPAQFEQEHSIRRMPVCAMCAGPFPPSQSQASASITHGQSPDSRLPFMAMRQELLTGVESRESLRLGTLRLLRVPEPSDNLPALV
ncbi:hypothetical protein OH77DRAFT_896889 [Trametes cingulata]|nr:hypothetical protein OH77DRAFT_896889 [Trametes cingulata]